MDSLWTLRYLSQLSCSSIDTTTALVISSRGRLSVWSHIWPGASMDVGPMSYWDVCFCGSTACLGRPSVSDLGRPCTSVLVVPHPAWNVRGHLSLWYYAQPEMSGSVYPCGPTSCQGSPWTFVPVVPCLTQDVQGHYSLWYQPETSGDFCPCGPRFYLGHQSLWFNILPGMLVPVVPHPAWQNPGMSVLVIPCPAWIPGTSGMICSCCPTSLLVGQPGTPESIAPETTWTSLTIVLRLDWNVSDICPSVPTCSLVGC